MSAESVLAIVAGHKIQTRRVVTWPRTISKRTRSLDPLARWKHIFPHPTRKGWIAADMPVEWFPTGAWDDGDGFVCPYGVPGDRLWVRESWALVPRTAYAASDGVCQTLRPGDDQDAAVYRAGWELSPPHPWRCGRFMPRWAARLFLEVTDVRVERVTAISAEDALAEGTQGQHSFAVLWDRLQAKRGYAFASGCWVWCISFRRVEGA